jgi:beta-glucosidase
VQLAVACGANCGASLDLTSVLAAAPPGVWQTLKVKLSDFRSAGADMAKVIEPFAVATSGRLVLSIKTVRLEADPSGTTRLPLAKR